MTQQDAKEFTGCIETIEKKATNVSQGKTRMVISNEVFGSIVNGTMEAIKHGSDDCDLHMNFFKDIITDVCHFRKTLKDIVERGHSLDCPAIDGGSGCRCPMGMAKGALKKDE